jgi:Cu+-exporting ATPase
MNVEYTCPMHPEIVREQPGACPICGMALEPRMVGLENAPNPELLDMTRRFWIAVALGAPVFLLTMADMVLGGGLMRVIDMRAINWIGLAFATPVVFWAGRPFFVRGLNSIVNRSPNVFTLIAMGVGSACAYSAAATLAPQMFPGSFRVHGVKTCHFCALSGKSEFDANPSQYIKQT